MKNTITLFFLLLLVVILYGLNEEYGWVSINLKNIAIGAAAGAGPLQYLKNLSNQKTEEKEQEERRYQYRTLTSQQFMNREKAKTMEHTPQQKVTSSNQENDLFNNPNALG